MSVIVGRALPDVQDGLKPVHRRILFAMNDLGLVPTKPYRRAACLLKFSYAVIILQMRSNVRCRVIERAAYLHCPGRTPISLSPAQLHQKQSKVSLVHLWHLEAEGSVRLSDVAICGG